MTARLLLSGRLAAARAVAVAAALLGGVLAGGPAQAAVLAANKDGGQQTGSGLSVLQTVLIFVGIPGLMFVVIALLVSATTSARGPRYRPGLGWWAAPVWFNGPPDADSAVRTATATTGGGGASARW